MNAKIKRFIVIGALGLMSLLGAAETVATLNANAAEKAKIAVSHDCSNVRLLAGEVARSC